ncbi:MAG: pseudouridine synthase [Acidimicrobiia bacterium]|nr:pseudouridine synthase [Acidimicrobiia bacterium]
MSRRKAEDLIRAGRVTIDGRTAVLGDRADPATARIAIDDTPLPVRPDLIYLLLNKPRGVISTAADTHGRRTVVDLVEAKSRVYPVGRLDSDSEGLLILTNDGTLADLVTHPRYGVTKTYIARVEGVPGRADLEQLQSGVELEDGLAAAESTKLVARHGQEALIEVVMTEGRKHEVRRMLAGIGLPVLRLVRTAIGPLRDNQLSPGESRSITTAEVSALYAAAGAAWDDSPAIIEHED